MFTQFSLVVHGLDETGATRGNYVIWSKSWISLTETIKEHYPYGNWVVIHEMHISKTGKELSLHQLSSDPNTFIPL